MRARERKAEASFSLLFYFYSLFLFFLSFFFATTSFLLLLRSYFPAARFYFLLRWYLLWHFEHSTKGCSHLNIQEYGDASERPLSRTSSPFSIDI
jgi:hypothetical protein